MLAFRRSTALGLTIFALLAGANAALAGSGQPSPWQLGLQQSATEVMDIARRANVARMAIAVKPKEIRR